MLVDTISVNVVGVFYTFTISLLEISRKGAL